MKHIMISIKPEWVEKILNGEKTLEIRKSFPKCVLDGEECIADIYCTKDPKHLVAPFRFVEGWFYKVYDDNTNYACGCTSNMGETINGKVVARWHLKNVIEFDILGLNVAGIKEDILKKSCLTEKQLMDYTRKQNCNSLTFEGFALHIEDLHIYDTPKELAEFGLKRPFQSWGYLNDTED